ncbi:hypothetical protein [Devosia sp. DBB001]|nr:hypothetical protein [Devosia sp. DBB001]
MKAIPDIAISIRQPWTWAVIHAAKDIENRGWRRPNPGLNFRGEVAIHAAQGMTQAEFVAAAAFVQAIGVSCPPAAELLRGGIIGVATVTDVVSSHPSPWWMGPRGLVLADARPVEFIPCRGALGFFKWQRDDEAIAPKPARWMMPKPVAPVLQEAFL